MRVYYSGMQDSLFNFKPNIGYFYLDSTITGTYLTNNFNRNKNILYPNPSSNTIYIKTHSSLFDHIEIFDQTGKLQIEKTFVPSSFYQINISTPS